jgi:N-acetylmuramoyl-L-alanine amidase
VAARIDPLAPVVGARVLPALRRQGPDRPEMLVIDSPNRDVRQGGPKDVSAIVLHHTASAADAQRIAMFFSRPSAQVSANYVVGKDGTLVQCVPDSFASWHAGRSTFAGRDNVNQFSLGIEICNLGDDTDPYPETQYRALGRLMAYLMATHGITWNGVTRHRDIAVPAGRKIDTSNNFSLSLLRQAVANAGGPALSQGPQAFGLGSFPSFN